MLASYYTSKHGQQRNSVKNIRVSELPRNNIDKVCDEDDELTSNTKIKVASKRKF